MNGLRTTEWRKLMGKPLTKLQKKYIDRMMNSKQKKTKEFEDGLKKESFDSQMKTIKEKLSPNGGKKPFKTIGRIRIGPRGF